MKLVKILIAFVLGLACILGLIFVAGGILIPAEKSFTQETEINASQETVWNVLNDHEKFPEWQDKLASVEIKDEKNWTEVTKEAGPIDFTIVSSDKPNKLQLKYSMGDNFTGEWHGELSEKAEGKTILKTTDKSVVNSWVMKVLMSAFFDIEDFAKDWNKKLKARAESIEKSS